MPPHAGHGAGPGHGADTSHGRWAWGPGSFGSRLIQGGCCTTFLLPRSSCRDSRLLQQLLTSPTPGVPGSCSPLPQQKHWSPTHAEPCQGKEGQGRSCAVPGRWWPMLGGPALCPSRWSGCRGLQGALGPGSLCKHCDHRGNVLTALASA